MRPYRISPLATFVGGDPLSGPVTQFFDFWSGWFKSVDQIGLVNIDIGKAGNAETEREILAEVGSYGRQLGTISDALAVLIKHAELDRTKLSKKEIAHLYKFEEMLEQVETCKKRR